MSDQLVDERQGLEKKDKTELQAIVSALGGTSNARMRKAELIDQILDLSGATARAKGEESGFAEASGKDAVDEDDSKATDGLDDDRFDTESDDSSTRGDDSAPSGESADSSNGRRSASPDRSGPGQKGDHPTGPDGEPLADWEIQVMEETGQGTGGRGRGSDRRNRNQNNQQKNSNQGRNEARSDDDDDDDDGNRRGRRRARNRGRDREDAGNDPVSNEPVEVEGYLDLRDEGYAFLRVNSLLPSRDDAYVSVKQVRQYKLRKGDHVVGRARPANRNEKNPALHNIISINSQPADQAQPRPRFDELTPLFPDERLVLEMKDEPLNMTTRIIDLLAPIGKGQRGLIVSPPKAGKTTIMKDIARAIETNNPEVELLVLLVDERPEEVTDMERSLTKGEVVSSTFDRPPEEHTAIAELTLERAKRMVEGGADVVLIVDGITRLARAYNMAGPQSGKALSGGIDAAAIYPPKRFLGAARNFEEGGSLTIMATALVETGSKMDEVIFEECKGTGNMELRLNRRLAEKRIFPAIDIDGSSTRNEELLRPKKEVEASWQLRRIVKAMGAEGDDSNAAGIEMLIERLAMFKTNADFLAEIAKARAV
ncbi:MAG: transcription termination factor Rho [Acidimicrobiia bacterium]|nr:transcription termination factor Rho [Acidimicrobiia bacterium]